ncbi:hypothetical protein Tco_0469480 [Tanacetum coccineum]
MISVRPQTPMAAFTSALIDAFAAGSPPFPLPPTSPAYDRRRFVLTAPLPGCDVAESSAAAAARPPKGQYDFVDTVEAGQGLIRSPGHDARTLTSSRVHLFSTTVMLQFCLILVRIRALYLLPLVP